MKKLLKSWIMTVSVISLVVLSVSVDFPSNKDWIVTGNVSMAIPWTLLHLKPVTKKGKQLHVTKGPVLLSGTQCCFHYSTVQHFRKLNIHYECKKEKKARKYLLLRWMKETTMALYILHTCTCVSVYNIWVCTYDCNIVLISIRILYKWQTKCWMASLNFALIKKWGVACQSESIQMDSSCYKQCKSSKFKSNANSGVGRWFSMGGL